MYVHVPLILFLLANAAPPTDASLIARGSESLARAATRAHRHIFKRGAGLARDIRLSVRGILANDAQQPAAIGSARVYCVNQPSPGLLPNNGTATSPANPVGTATSPPSPSASASSSSSPWKLLQTYQGTSFFDDWNFTTGADLTHGFVTYVDENTAKSASLIDVNSAGNAVMRVETTPQVAGTRQSVRVQTVRTYTGALIVMDSVHIPTGCGTWPAFWSDGPNWPAGGEIDIVEGVNDYTNNQATLHTNPGCSMSSSSPSTLGISGTLVGGTDCAAADTGNAGCGIRASQTNSFGAAFNNNGGGVYIMKWDNTGITVWFFPRNSIPADITANAPQPSTWGTPMANFPASSCNPSNFFSDHQAIFDITLCGDWAGAVWGTAGVPGQDQSCAQITGVAQCQDYVLNHGANFTEAYWEVKYVQIYDQPS
ncbi:glycoside hydrolase family 16 protein [Phlebiopsis gigantea 11061_1 CR5-6]|uniref:Glycoside hydrolase family 16 protein n=1 Tax=Phlebiopsis gigantea (strain 11061_1 CR5-6) TaxID=745531 RepID=A0A0C3NF26_PHLG1|nr:glycoside hydrolase family 16 protein [Phlebiopsis gigantea 11061_1 CR5-6]